MVRAWARSADKNNDRTPSYPGREHYELSVDTTAPLGGRGSALAQADYPTRPVRVIVPYPPAGGADTVSRLLFQKLGEAWGQQVIIDNRPGASMMIGHELGAKAAPDGYTLVMSSNNHTINPSVYKKIPYDR